MNRRNLIRTGLLSGAAVAAAPSLVLAKSSPKKIAAAPDRFRKIPLGDLELTVLSDGHILQTPVQPFVAPRGPQAEVNRLLSENFRPTDHVDLAMNVLLVKTADRLVLLDAGMGLFASGETGRLLDNLKEAGHQPDDITDVLISHAHPDHIGGVMDKSGALVFPKANIFISETEARFWQQATPKDFEKSMLAKRPDVLKQMLGGIQQVVKGISPKARYCDFTRPLYDVFSFQPIPGHTPGMVMTILQSKGEQLAYIADLIHHDILLFAHPEWGFAGDTDLDMAIATRKKVLAQLAGSKTKTHGYHLPCPGLGHVKTEGDAFRWIPEAFATF